MQYTETQLSKLIEDVEKEFTAHLAKAEEESKALSAPETEIPTLAKAEDGEKKPEKKPEEDSKEEHKPEAEAKPAAPAMPAEGEHKPEAPAPAADHGDGHDYDEEDIQHLHKMYGSMSKAELKVHHDACKAALDKCMSMGKSEIEQENKLSPKPKVKGENLDSDKQNGGIEGQEPANALGPKSPASDAHGAKINKSEHDRRNGGKIEEQAPANSPGAKSPASDANGAKMQKSENTEAELLKSELETVKSEHETLKKNFDAVQAFLTKLVEKRPAPAAKAITSLEVIAKSEGSREEEQPLTKSEIDSKLLQKSQDPSLKKSDRDAINAYYLDGAGVEKISHLLK